MKLWAALVGVRDDLPLSRKWWHKLAIAGSIFSSLFVFLAGASVGARSVQVVPTADNILSVTLLSLSKGRPGLTTLRDLADRSAVGVLGPDGRVEPLGVDDTRENIRCMRPPAFKAGTSFTHVDPRTPELALQYRVVSDTADQPANQLRHCAATNRYASLTPDRILAYRLDGGVIRRLTFGGLVIGAFLVPFWLVVYWNVYFRALVPIYARRRRRRLRRSRSLTM